MKLSTHIGHCIQMLAKHGDKDVAIPSRNDLSSSIGAPPDIQHSNNLCAEPEFRGIAHFVIQRGRGG